MVEALVQKIEILVVEDSRTDALTIRHFLESNDFNVTVAEDGEKALSYLNENRPDLILSDVIMPNMDGYELCRTIKSRASFSGIPVILVTALAEPEDIINGLKCGADNFVTKPFNSKLLLSQIRFIMANRELRQNPNADFGIEIYFAGQKHFINSDRIQILNLLFSTYEHSMQQMRELARINKELRTATKTIEKLEGILPICCYCKKIRDDKNDWHSIESYISNRSTVEFSHGICPKCLVIAKHSLE